VNECKPLGTGCLSCHDDVDVVATTMTFVVLIIVIMLAVFVFGQRILDVLRYVSRALGLEVGRCRLIVSKPVLNARLVSALETKYDELLSNVAFNFNLRRYIEAAFSKLTRGRGGSSQAGAYTRPRFGST